MLHAFSKYALLVLIFAAGSLGACQNYKDQLQRGQGYYEQNQYEEALAVFRNLEADQGALTEPEVVRYCYLRGMTDFRLGLREHARYWLGLAKAADLGGTSALLEDERERLDKTLDELNRSVFGIEDLPEDETNGEADARACGGIVCPTGSVCKGGDCVIGG